ncbi:MAG: putative toxin-antitoxin system toxin component, PIN family, partial [Candidatus Rokubacteria bacterium]|nr:putative toxin-antitoxin system toxin component, PIN family [Candidatus Rokubacteria bacterium]
MSATVVLDTNVWVSAFLNPHGFPAKLLDAWIDGAFQVVISAPLMEELAHALSKPRLMQKYGYSDQDLWEYLAHIVSRAQEVTLAGEIVLSRDPKDNPVIETALMGGAHFLVSRDEDLTRDQPLAAHLSTRGITVVT